MDYELYHHGVLGMKWGVRRFQPYPEGKKPNGAKEIGEATKVHKRTPNKIVNDSDPTKTFLYKQNRYDEDIVLKKGDYLYRADGKSQIDPKKKAIYTSLKNDAIGYLIASQAKNGMTMDMKVKNGNNGRPYSIKLQLQEDLIIPSYKKSVDTFISTIDRFPSGWDTLKESGKIFPKKYKGDSYQLDLYQYLNKHKSKGQEYINKELKRVNVNSMDDLKSEAYRRFVSTLFLDSTRKKLFFDSLEKQGYNAIVDEFDYKVASDKKTYEQKGTQSTPMIVFKKGAVTQVGSKPMDERDKDYFIDRNYGKDPQGNKFKPYTKAELEKKYPGKTKDWDDWLEDRQKKKR